MEAEMSSDGCKGKISLVIFDKDGTLISFDAIWLWWVEEFAKGVAQSVAHSVKHDIFKSLQYCDKTKKVPSSSPIAYFTNENLTKFLVTSLIKHSLSADECHAIIESNWRQLVCEKEPTMEQSVLPLFDVRQVFENLKQAGIKIAVCTSDSRSPTEAQLQYINAFSYVDYMICGDDDISVPKPAPDNVTNICRRLGVDLLETAMIGDTVADVQMSRAAGAGLVVGVLSGVARETELKPYCDILLDNASHILQYLVKK